MSRVNFNIGGVVIESEFRDTPTARKIIDALPIQSSGSYWGNEFYFDVPVVAAPEPDATDVVDPGTAAAMSAGRPARSTLSVKSSTRKTSRS